MIRYEAKVDRSEGIDACHPWTGARDADGYGRMVVDSIRTKPMIHRWAYQILVGPLKPGEIVRHACDNPPCQNRQHWRKGSHADNMSDALERGRIIRGTQRVNAKLTENAVREIRESSDRPTTLAKKFGVTPQLICNVRASRAWRWVV